MRTSLSIALSLTLLTGCESPLSAGSWDDDWTTRTAECDGPLGPTDPALHQGLTSPSAPAFARVGDMAVIDGTSIALGGLTNVQFYELDESGDYQPSTYIAGPSGFAFGRTLGMDNGLAVISADNYQLPGQSRLTGRLRTYRKDDNNTWALDPQTPYIHAADMGLVTGSTNIGFGYTLKVHQDTMVVGIQRADGVGATPKAIFTFTDDMGWQLDTLLPDAGIGPMALHGDYLAAATRSTGVIRIYKRTDDVWSTTPVTTIAKPAGASSQYAACSGCMAFDGDRLVFGDIYANNQVGGAYVFERQNPGEAFVQTQLLTPSGTSNGLNGWRLTASEDRLYVGSGSGGKVSLYEWSSALGEYILTQTLTDAATTGFGRGVSVDGSRLLIGRGTAAQSEGVGADRAELYVGTEGVDGFCIDDVNEVVCAVGTPFDWDGVDGDDGCRGTNTFVDPSVAVPAGTQMGDNVSVLRGASLGSGNILHNGVTLGGSSVLGDNNVLLAGVVVGRGGTLGSNNEISASSILARRAIVGDDTVFGGRLGYAAELGSHIDAPDTVLGSLATLGSPATEPGDIDCPGPLVMARDTNIATAPGSVFRCTGLTIIGPESVVQSAELGSGVRIRKNALLQATVTAGNNVRLGRDVSVGGSVTINDGTRVSASVQLCDTTTPFTGRLARSFVDPSCP